MGHIPHTPHDPATPNPLGLRGIDFVEVAVQSEDQIAPILRSFGFTRELANSSGTLSLWRQNDIGFVVNSSTDGFAADFRGAHGPSICAMGWRVDNAGAAFDEAVVRSAKPYAGAHGAAGFDLPAIVGIGGSLIYFVDRWAERGNVFGGLQPTGEVAGKGLGFTVIDHLTNNVHKGTLDNWATFYRDVFGFTQVRHFDIRGEKTGLYSFALRSPDGSFCIPINEGTESKSQIEEYLREYNGPGVQHIAFLTDDLVAALDGVDRSAVQFLDIDDEYYASVFDRVPGVVEDRTKIREHQILVDGDDDGYLLQIFTKNLLGPIFVELIQRRNHLSFGEGNFGALFRSIERDQERRGVI